MTTDEQNAGNRRLANALEGYRVRMVMDWITEQIAGIELNVDPSDVFARYHLTQLRHYRHVLNADLLRLNAAQDAGTGGEGGDSVFYNARITP